MHIAKHSRTVAELFTYRYYVYEHLATGQQPCYNCAVPGAKSHYLL